MYDKKKKTMERLEEQLTKLEVQATDKVSLFIIVFASGSVSLFYSNLTQYWA